MCAPKKVLTFVIRYTGGGGFVSVLVEILVEVCPIWRLGTAIGALML